MDLTRDFDKKEKYSFEHWDLHTLTYEFGLVFIEKSETLNDWLNVTGEIEPQERAFLTKIRDALERYGEYWNEDELKLNCIGPLVTLAAPVYGKAHAFSQRELSAEINGNKIYGRADWLFAEGMDAPERSFFCLHEYKRFRFRDSDPFAQALVAMYVAKVLNGDDKPVWGAYVIGERWRFLVLEDKNFARSRIFYATTDDIFGLLAVLRALGTQIAKYYSITKPME